MIPVSLCRKFAIAVYSYTELSYVIDQGWGKALSNS